MEGILTTSLSGTTNLQFLESVKQFFLACLVNNTAANLLLIVFRRRMHHSGHRTEMSGVEKISSNVFLWASLPNKFEYLFYMIFSN